MRLKVLYFASIREAVGSDSDRLDVPSDVRTTGELRRWLCARGGAWREALGMGSTVRIAVNQTMAGAEQALREDDEVAFFPPVTGG